MSLRKKIEQAVDKAFKAVGDIASQITLQASTQGSYDFATGTASATITSTTIDAIVMSVEQKPDAEEILAPRKEVYVKEKELSNPALYDTVVINNVNHTIINFTHSPGLITLLVTEG